MLLMLVLLLEWRQNDTMPMPFGQWMSGRIIAWLIFAGMPLTAKTGKTSTAQRALHHLDSQSEAR